MLKLLSGICAAALCSAALAEDAGVRLTRDELIALVTNTETSYVTKSGSLHRWRNDPGGKFIVSTDNKKHSGVMGVKGRSAAGTWRVSDEGKYCVQIEWQRETEDWCAFVVRSEDGGYYLNRVDPARKIEFLK